MKSAYGISVPETLEDVCSPSRCGLIIYDMQAGIVPQVSEGKTIVSRCQQLLEAARASGFRVYFTRHFFLPNQAAGSGQLRRSMIWQSICEPSQTRPLITQASPAYGIVPELAATESEVLIDKITMSAFESTFLNVAMRDAHLEAFVIAGIALEVGIEPTVRHGADLNYVPIVVTDACGSKTAEAKARSLAVLEETGEVIAATTDAVTAIMRSSSRLS
jgi:nicotinamidase-related amidase